MVSDLLFPHSALKPVVNDIASLYSLGNIMFLSLHYMGRGLEMVVIILKGMLNTVGMLTNHLTLPMQCIASLVFGKYKTTVFLPLHYVGRVKPYFKFDLRNKLHK